MRRETLMCRPGEIELPPAGLPLTGTLGRAELEIAAALVLRYQQAMDPEEWRPMVTGEFFEFLKGDEYCLEVLGGLVRPNLVGLINDEWITGWNTDDDPAVRKAGIGVVTDKFVEAVSNPRVGRRDWHAIRKWS